MEPAEYNDLASELIDKGGVAKMRTAFSRCYYGSFLYCKKRINGIGFNLPRDATAHEMIQRYLNNCGITELSIVASFLNDLRNKRNKADYDLEDRTTEIKKNAQLALLSSKRIIEDVNNVLKKNSNEIKKAIEKYRKNIGLQ